MSDSNPLGQEAKAPADPQTTDGDYGQPGSEGEDAETAFDPSLLDTIVEKHTKPQQSTDKATKNVVPTADMVRQKTLETWTDRYIRGDEDKDGNVYDLDHPKMPDWVKKEIEKSINPKQSAPERQYDDLEYKLMMREIPNLPPSKQKKLTETFDAYMSLGKDIDPAKALRFAMDNLSATDEAYKRGKNRQARATAPNGDPIMTQKTSGLTESAEKLGAQLGISPEDRKKYATNPFTI